MPFADSLSPFKNQPLTDFSNASNRAEMDAALRDVATQLGRTYTLIIEGKTVHAKKTFESINPSEARQVIGKVQNADRALADRALAAAVKTFETWRRVSQEERARLLLRMADILRRRKLEFNAWLIFEAGKSWQEADADVAEAIDFLEYYARQSLIPPPAIPAVPSERNEYLYLPLGPVVVIPPWNFPLAILVGMTSAAMVTGNTVVLKPSSQTPVIASKFMELVEQAGVPAGVVNLLTGAGRTIGDALVGDPRTRMVAFTGSNEVGLHINALASRTTKGQIWIKRVIAEMGGKNAIVVDASAELDKAVDGVLASAFGYQGQKCSACSRAYIHQGIYDEFSRRLTDKARALRIGPAVQYDNAIGPVISRDAMLKIQRYIALGKREGRLLAGGASVKGLTGFYLQPTIFDRIAAKSRLIQEEIFGPVLVLSKVSTFQEGLKEANSTAYGLTGAVFTQNLGHMEEAKQIFFCGNLYLNRKCTGALVGGHPFGGFNLSGTDSKAGGPEYLLLFRQGQAISRRV